MTPAAIIVFSIALGLIVFVFITTDWRRVITILHRGPGWATSEPDRWRRVHLDGDRRQPFDHGARR